MLTTSIVVPVWNNVALTRQLLDVLLIVSPPDQLVVVNNGSTDGTFDYLQSLHAPKLDIIANDTNLGFTRAVNQGLRIASGEVICVLSNDVRILAADWLGEVCHHLADNPKHLVGSLLIPNNPWTADVNGAMIPYIAGYMMAFRRKFLIDVGYLDEQFWAYFEDVDWSMRAMQAGYKLTELEAARDGLYHYGGRTGMLLGHRAMEICTESKIAFGKKYGIEWHWEGQPPLSAFPREDA